MSALAKALDKAARARAMGYAEEPFFRGEASGKLPGSYDSAFFSRDPEYAGGFAARGGQQAPREFRLHLDKAFRDYEPVTAATYARILDALGPDNARLAGEMVDAVAPGKNPQWFSGFARHRPDVPVAESGAHVRQMLDVGTNNSADDVFRRAGYDALDFGRDVRKLTGDGIRLSDAAFDPAKASSRDITAGVAGLAAGAGALTAGIPEEAMAGKSDFIKAIAKAATDQPLPKPGETLPMDQASRLERAREMGFDTDRVLYRGGTSKVDEFDGLPYLTDNPRAADHYAAGEMDPISPADYARGAHIMPVYAKAQKPFVAPMLPGGNLDVIEAYKQLLGKDFKWSRDMGTMADIAKKAGEKGYDVVEFRGMTDLGGKQTQYIPTSTTNIRSTNAAFDPAKADSSNLMASHLAPFLVGGGAGIGAMGAFSTEAEAGKLPTTRPLNPMPSGRLPERDMRLATMRSMYGTDTADDAQALARHRRYQTEVGEPEARSAVFEAMKPLSVTAAELVLGPTPALGAGRPTWAASQAELAAEAAAGADRRAGDESMVDMLRRVLSRRGQ